DYWRTLGTLCLGFCLVEQLQRERAVGDRGSSSKRRRQHRRLGDFFASGASAFGPARVHIQAIRTLRSACHREGDQFSILSWNGAVFTSHYLVKLHECGEFGWRQLAEFAQAFQVIRIVIVHYCSSEFRDVEPRV